MRIGLKTPVVVQHPGLVSPWEPAATVEDLVRIARAADELSFDHLICSEHVAVPATVAAERGATYWDPVATLAFLAAHTRRIRLATSVTVLGYHHPLALAKRYGTLDRLSGGRVVVGVGVGSLREEFDLLGAEWTNRGAVADDALAALRTALAEPRPRYHGSRYSFEDFVVEPRPVQPHVPVWVGGRTLRSLRRAVALADGWAPFGLPIEGLIALLARVELPAGFELVLSPSRGLDPLADPSGAARALAALHDAGATLVEVGVRSDSPGHHADQLARLRELADEIA